MIDPKRHQRLMELSTVELYTQILYNTRDELYLNMHFLDISLSSPGFKAAATPGIGTDGFVIYYNPDYLFRLYRQGGSYINRVYLHAVFHCLFYHMDTRREQEKEHWDLACDTAMESVLDGLYKKCIHRPQSAFRRETYLRLGEKVKVLTAEDAYTTLKKMNLTGRQYNRLTTESYVDNRARWCEDDARRQAQLRQNKRNDNREKMWTRIESMTSEPAESADSLMEQVRVENRERYDYKKFLRKSSVPRKELQVSRDSFDYIYYAYGLSMCDNMPLIEPLETREIYRVGDFAVVTDTSMSCSGGLVRRLLEEIYTVLCEPETYFKEINIHIIQCNDKIQSDKVITSQDEMDVYMRDFVIIGEGGADFRPAFEYVSRLQEQGAFRKLQGLLYFADGEGTYPMRRPVYDTAFVFMKEQYTDVSVPPWVIKLISEPEEIESLPHAGSERSMVSPTYVGPAESIGMENSDEH